MLTSECVLSFFLRNSSPACPHLRFPFNQLLPLCSFITANNHHFCKIHMQQKPLFSEDLQLPLISSSSKTQITSASMGTCEGTQNPLSSPSKKTRKKKKAPRDAPKKILRHKLDMCSKNGNLTEALHLYDEARANQIPLSQHHYNVLLFLCSCFPSASVGKNEALTDLNLCLERGFEIFHQMSIDEIPPNEATFTSLARLAAAKEDPDLAFDLIKSMKNHKIPPRLRSYGPALFGFCKKGDFEGAYAVEAHMSANSVPPEEPELAALIEVSAEAAKGVRVYQYLHQLRTTVRQVSESTALILEKWFQSPAATEVGVENWDDEKVNEGVVRCGGGAHGTGWLGKGQWKVLRSKMDTDGVCAVCRDKLVCIDIDPVETENFANSLAILAFEREAKADFTRFQEWLTHSGPFDAVIDGANVSLQDKPIFSFCQLNKVVNGMRQKSPSKKYPLVVLHSSRLKGGQAEKPNNKKLIEIWRKAGALYSTPPGSYDDWYWLYAAVSNKCLLVSNDKMRDHLFELFGKSFFPLWIEKHQVHFTFSREEEVTFHMPPPYSIVIQESPTGSWHIPMVTEDDNEMPRQWVCATRSLGALSTTSA